MSLPGDTGPIPRLEVEDRGNIEEGHQWGQGWLRHGRAKMWKEQGTAGAGGTAVNARSPAVCQKRFRLNTAIVSTEFNLAFVVHVSSLV